MAPVVLSVYHGKESEDGGIKPEGIYEIVRAGDGVNATVDTIVGRAFAQTVRTRMGTHLITNFPGEGEGAVDRGIALCNEHAASYKDSGGGTIVIKATQLDKV